ncbi:MAG: polyamine aminopropyltransferase [Chlamydiota bacterium]
MEHLACTLATASLFAHCDSSYLETLYPNWGQAFAMQKIIFQEKTDYQDLVIFDNPTFGRVLALDGAIQVTEKDEPIYHEMMVHVPLFTFGTPASVLIIGGGDGGILREVLKHPSVKSATVVEIDPSVIEVSKRYLPTLSSGAFNDPRAHILIEDASLFIKHSTDTFDVIICDSTDPFGPGAVLFTSEFYEDCKKRLHPKGIFVNQNGVPFLQNTEMSLTFKNRSPHFKYVSFYTASIPTYVGGMMVFGWASDENYCISEKELKKRSTLLQPSMFYYTPQIHKAAFALPAYMEKAY